MIMKMIFRYQKHIGFTTSMMILNMTMRMIIIVLNISTISIITSKAFTLPEGTLPVFLYPKTRKEERRMILLRTKEGGV